MTFYLLLYIAASLYLCGWLILLYFRWKKEQSIKNSTDRTTGRVIGYATWKNLQTPQVEYVVHSQSYRQVLKFPVSVLVPEGGDQPTDVPQTRTWVLEHADLKTVSTVPYKLDELFPIGHELTVYFNPQDPKLSYVERYDNRDRFYRAILPLIGGLVIALPLLFVLYWFTIWS